MLEVDEVAIEGDGVQDLLVARGVHRAAEEDVLADGAADDNQPRARRDEDGPEEPRHLTAQSRLDLAGAAHEADRADTAALDGLKLAEQCIERGGLARRNLADDWR